MIEPFVRWYLAGEDDYPEPGPRSKFTAADLLLRLDRETRVALNIAAVEPRVWDERMLRRKEEMNKEPSKRNGDWVHPVYHHSQEANMMQSLGIGLELATAHHPSLRATFPMLVAWIYRTLRYVVIIEDRIEDAEAALARTEKARVNLRERCIALGDEKEGNLEAIEGLQRAFRMLEAQRTEEGTSLRHQLEDSRHELECMKGQRDAWKVAAEVATASLSFVMTQLGVEVKRPETPKEITDAAEAAMRTAR